MKYFPPHRSIRILYLPPTRSNRMLTFSKLFIIKNFHSRTYHNSHTQRLDGSNLFFHLQHTVIRILTPFSRYIYPVAMREELARHTHNPGHLRPFSVRLSKRPRVAEVDLGLIVCKLCAKISKLLEPK